jgi:hypothetical protein
LRIVRTQAKIAFAAGASNRSCLSRSGAGQNPGANTGSTSPARAGQPAMTNRLKISGSSTLTMIFPTNLKQTMKKIGITADNYKLDTFQKELANNGFPTFTVSPFTVNMSVIKVMVKEDDVVKLGNVIRFVEMGFQRKKGQS